MLLLNLASVVRTSSAPGRTVNLPMALVTWSLFSSVFLASTGGGFEVVFVPLIGDLTGDLVDVGGDLGVDGVFLGPIFADSCKLIRWRLRVETSRYLFG